MRLLFSESRANDREKGVTSTGHEVRQEPVCPRVHVHQLRIEVQGDHPDRSFSLGKRDHHRAVIQGHRGRRGPPRISFDGSECACDDPPVPIRRRDPVGSNQNCSRRIHQYGGGRETRRSHGKTLRRPHPASSRGASPPGSLLPGPRRAARSIVPDRVPPRFGDVPVYHNDVESGEVAAGLQIDPGPGDLKPLKPLLHRALRHPGDDPHHCRRVHSCIETPGNEGELPSSRELDLHREDHRPAGALVF